MMPKSRLEGGMGSGVRDPGRQRGRGWRIEDGKNRIFFTKDLTSFGSNAKVLYGSGATGEKGRAGVIWPPFQRDGGREFFDNLKRRSQKIEVRR